MKKLCNVYQKRTSTAENHQNPNFCQKKYGLSANNLVFSFRSLLLTTQRTNKMVALLQTTMQSLTGTKTLMGIEDRIIRLVKTGMLMSMPADVRTTLELGIMMVKLGAMAQLLAMAELGTAMKESGVMTQLLVMEELGVTMMEIGIMAQHLAMAELGAMTTIKMPIPELQGKMRIGEAGLTISKPDTTGATMRTMMIRKMFLLQRPAATVTLTKASFAIALLEGTSNSLTSPKCCTSS